jgi:hypothetical protein
VDAGIERHESQLMASRQDRQMDISHLPMTGERRNVGVGDRDVVERKRCPRRALDDGRPPPRLCQDA